MQATNHNVLIKVISEDKIGSFYLPDNLKKGIDISKGTILSVGSMCNTDLKAGMTVIFNKDEGRDADGLLCIDEGHLLAIVTS